MVKNRACSALIQQETAQLNVCFNDSSYALRMESIYVLTGFAKKLNVNMSMSYVAPKRK